MTEQEAIAAAWNTCAKLCYRLAAAGISASTVRDVPPIEVEVMRQMFGNMRRANAAAFAEVICEYAQNAAFGIAEVVGLQAEIEAERAELSTPPPRPEDEPTQPGVVLIPPEAKGEP